MAPRTIYANLADGLSPLSLWDASLADMGSLGVIPCTASGTNAITLTPVAGVNAPNVAIIPQASQLFSFKPAAATTAPVTVKVVSAAGSSSFYNLYRVDGATQAGNGDLITTTTYLISFVQALNSGAGGYQIIGPPTTSIQSVVNDTNVTGSITGTVLTLGWTGTLAAGRLNGNVVQAVTNDTNIQGSISAQNLTFSWAGQLGLTRGGTNNSLVASAGGMVWSDASKLNVLSGTATANQMLVSGASVTPAWTTNTWPTTNAQGDLLYGSALNTVAALAKNTTATRYLANTGTSNAPNWDQVNLANGVTGNLPVGNLNSGTSASASTFWRGDGIWATPAGAGTVTSVTGNGVTITGSGTIPPPYGIVNHSIAVSASAGALTIALKDNTGADPSATSPVNGYFRNVTGTTGSWTQLSVTGALSLTLPSTSTLGITSSTACRIWIVLFNDASTARLGAINCSLSTQIFPLTEGIPASSTAVSGSATSAGVFYTGSAVSSKSFLIVGYIEWNSTGMTAGTWTTTNLNSVQSFGPGIKKPGDSVQSLFITTATGASTSSTTYATALSNSITPTSAANLIMVACSGTSFSANGLNSGFVTLFRSSTQLQSNRGFNGNTSSIYSFGALSYLDFPNTASSTTYAVKVRGDNTNIMGWGTAGDAGAFGSLMITEIMV